jgi:integrase
MAVKKLSSEVIHGELQDKPATGNRVVWDSIITGLGVRITAKGHVSFVFRYVVDGRERRFTLGDYGAAPKLTVSAAREMVRKREFTKEGKKLSSADPLGDVESDRASKTMNDLCDRYISDHAEPRKRASSLANDKAVIMRLIRPRFGTRRVGAISYADIDDLHRSLKDTPYQANRVLALLFKMFSLALTRWHYRTDGTNPCKGIERYPEEKRERYLTPDELQRLLRALAEHSNKQSANAIRLLLMTGARRGEALSATWGQFDLDRGVWTKPSAHTKQKRRHIVPLSTPAKALLESMKPGQPSEPLFPSPRDAESSQGDLKRFWRTVCKTAGIKAVRVHDLRHSFASYLASSGASLPLIGDLLGHTNPGTTARYAHLLDDPKRKAADTVGAIISAAETGEQGAEIVPLKRA